MSQQAPALRRPSQSQAEENAMLSVVDGWMKRQPTEHVAKIMSGTVSDALVHTINRDTSERYKVVIVNGALKVFDLTGAEKTVTFPNGKAYLATATPSSAIRAQTIADYTFITNNEITTAMSSALTAVTPPQAIAFVKLSEVNNYRIILDGTSYTYTRPSSATDAPTVAAGLLALIPAGTYDVAIVRATISIKRVDGADFTMSVSGPNDGDIYGFKNTIQTFTDLPTYAPTGYHVEIIGDDISQFDNYYVRFVPLTAGDTFANGYWKETIRQGVKYTYDAATMPHVLIRNNDGTFTFKVATWTDRVCGDDTTNVVPSFIGNTINDVFFDGDRLYFLSDSNAVGSEIGKYFNFFRTTVTALLDTDVIDVSANQIAVLRGAVDFDEKTVLFSDRAQFMLAGGDLTTPKSATVKQVTQYENDPTCKPVNAGTLVHFTIPRGSYSGMMEFYTDPVTGKPTAQEVTAHVPHYVPAGIKKLSSNIIDQITVASTSGDSGALYVYKYYFANGQKVQAAWNKWTFSGAVVSHEFLNSVLYLVVQRADGLYLEKLDTSSSRRDAGVQYLTLLDRRVDNTQCASSYDSTAHRTTWTLPYPVSAAEYQVVTRYAAPGDIAGVLLNNIAQTGSTVSADGDWHTTPVYIGEQYRAYRTFSQQFATQQLPSGVEETVPDARMTLLFLTLEFQDTGYFTVEVDYDHRPGVTSITSFEGRTIALPDDVLDTAVLNSGEFRLRIGADARRCSITIVNDSHLPCAIQAAGFEARIKERAKAI